MSGLEDISLLLVDNLYNHNLLYFTTKGDVYEALYSALHLPSLNYYIYMYNGTTYTLHYHAFQIEIQTCTPGQHTSSHTRLIQLTYQILSSLIYWV